MAEATSTKPTGEATVETPRDRFDVILAQVLDLLALIDTQRRREITQPGEVWCSQERHEQHG
jgi:hypothetical protein